MLILGCDPGKSGAIAVLAPDGSLDVVDMPVSGKDVDEAALALAVSRLVGIGPAHAFIEAVHAMPKQGVSSTFAFGQAYGALRGVLAGAGISRTLITPAVWKRAVKVGAHKDAARARASELFPAQAGLWSRVKDHNRAEAALIAWYGARVEQAAIHALLGDVA